MIIALLALQKNKLLQFLGCNAFAATFRRTGLVLLVLPASTSLWFPALFAADSSCSDCWGGLLALHGVNAPELDYYLQGYIEAEYQSKGAVIRVALCTTLLTVAFLANRRSS